MHLVAVGDVEIGDLKDVLQALADLHAHVDGPVSRETRDRHVAKEARLVAARVTIVLVRAGGVDSSPCRGSAGDLDVVKADGGRAKEIDTNAGDVHKLQIAQQRRAPAARDDGGILYIPPPAAIHASRPQHAVRESRAGAGVGAEALGAGRELNAGPQLATIQRLEDDLPMVSAESADSVVGECDEGGLGKESHDDVDSHSRENEHMAGARNNKASGPACSGKEDAKTGRRGGRAHMQTG